MEEYHNWVMTIIIMKHTVLLQEMDMFVYDGKRVPGIVKRDRSLAHMNEPENQSNFLLKEYVIDRKRKMAVKSSLYRNYTFVYSLPNPQSYMECAMDIDGKRQGPFVVFDREKHPLIKGTFVDDIISGKVMVYNAQGIMLFDGNYKKGKKEGGCTEYKDGSIKFRGNYFNDERNGPGEEFNEKGVAEPHFYTNGEISNRKIDGDRMFEYDKEGHLIMYGEYSPISYKFDGFAVVYDANNTYEVDRAVPIEGNTYHHDEIVSHDFVFKDRVMEMYKNEELYYRGGFLNSYNQRYPFFGDGYLCLEDGTEYEGKWKKNKKIGPFIKTISKEDYEKENDRREHIRGYIPPKDKYSTTDFFAFGLLIGDRYVMEEFYIDDKPEFIPRITKNVKPWILKFTKSLWCLSEVKKTRLVAFLTNYEKVILYGLGVVGLLLIALIVFLIIPKGECSIGTLQPKAGFEWRGQICGNKAEGEGYMYHNSILVYHGNCSNNFYNGYGTSYYPNGKALFVGMWKNDLQTDGTFYSQEGCKTYSGQCNGSSRNGEGASYYCNNQKEYVGKWSYDFILQGEHYLEDGSIYYNGTFLSGKRSGSGMMYYPSGKLRFDGEWNNDIIVQGSAYREDGTLLYKGTMYGWSIRIEKESDREKIKPIVEDITFASNYITFQTAFTFSGNEMLKKMVFESRTLANIMSFSIRNEPNLETILFEEDAMTSVFRTDTDNPINRILEIYEKGRSFSIVNAPRLQSIICDKGAMSHITLLTLENLPSLKLIQFGVITSSTKIKDSSFNVAIAHDLVFADMPSLETVILGNYAIYYPDIVSFVNLPKLTNLTMGPMSYRRGSACLTFDNVPQLEMINNAVETMTEIQCLRLRNVSKLAKLQHTANKVFSSLSTVYVGNNINYALLDQIRSIREVNTTYW